MPAAPAESVKMNNGKINDWDQVPLILTIQDLADLLKKSVASVRSDITRAPGRLPPPLKIPGARAVRFSKDSLIEWIEGLASPPAAPSAPAPARRRGRPAGSTTQVLQARRRTI